MTTMAGDDDLDVSAFMNVVKLFSCKLCVFRSTSQEEFVWHVRSEHMNTESKGQDSNGTTESAPAKPPDTKNLDVPQNNGAIELQESAPAESPLVSEADVVASELTTLSSLCLDQPKSSSSTPVPTVSMSMPQVGIASSVDSAAVVVADGSASLQTQGTAILGGARGGEEEGGISYVLVPKDIGHKQQVGDLIQLQMSDGVLAETAPATSIDIGDIQVSPQQLQQILDAAKSSSAPLPINGGSQISLIPVSVGGQSSVGVSSAPQQFTIVTTEDGPMLSLGGPLLYSDASTSLALKTESLFATGGAGGRGDGMLVNLGALNGLLEVSSLAAAASNAQPPAANTQVLVRCGDCQLTFMQEDFVEHIRVNHPTTMPAISSALKDPPDAKAARGISASVGTQIYRKKPGRKRKSEMVFKEEPKDTADDSDDEDWRPGMSESGRRKRKARAPRGLRTDTCHKLSVHMEIHGEARSYTCDQCGKGFKQFSQMRNHQVTHATRETSDPNKWYSSKRCDICTRGFANSKCLKKHVQAVHSNEKPFRCPHCDHCSSRKAMMDLHIRTHTGEKPFQCDVCSYASGDHNSLRRHKMRHTGEHKYKCNICSYSCIQAISLKTHMASKHPGQGGIFACTLCNFRTVNNISFRNHQSDHQNGIVTTHSRKRSTARVNEDQQQNQLSESVVMEAGDGEQVLEVPEVQLTIKVQQNGAMTVLDHQFRRLVELEPVLQISAQTFLQYALAAAGTSSSDGQPSQFRMTLPGSNLQVNISITSEATPEGDIHNIVLTQVSSTVPMEGEGVAVGMDSAVLEGVLGAEEGGQAQVLFADQEMQGAGVQGTQVEGQVVYISHDSGQADGAVLPQGQTQNVTLEFATIADGNGTDGAREPGVVAMDTETADGEHGALHLDQ